MEERNSALPNGAAAAAILAAAVGCGALGFLTAAAETIGSFRPLVTFYPPAGPLTGQSTVSVLVWLAVWAYLHSSWKTRQIEFGKIFLWTIVFLAGAIIGTFPPPFEELGEVLRSMR